MTPGPQVPNGAQHAIDIGYVRGRKLRQDGAKEADLDFQRSVFEQAATFELECGPTRAKFYKEWRLGFDAGYLGSPKPLADSFKAAP